MIHKGSLTLIHKGSLTLIHKGSLTLIHKGSLTLIHKGSLILRKSMTNILWVENGKSTDSIASLMKKYSTSHHRPVHTWGSSKLSPLNEQTTSRGSWIFSLLTTYKKRFKGEINLEIWLVNLIFNSIDDKINCFKIQLLPIMLCYCL